MDSSDKKINDLAKRVEKIEKYTLYLGKIIDRLDDEIQTMIKKIKSVTNTLRPDTAPQFITVFIGASIAYILFSLLLSSIEGAGLAFVERFTSILTAVVCGITAVWGGYTIARREPKITGKLGIPLHSAGRRKIITPGRFTVLLSFIFSCYLGYVLIDFGGTYPIAAAVGFNIATLASNAVIVGIILDNYYDI